MNTGKRLDTIHEVHTPEGVTLQLLTAGPFPRALAWGIDAGIRSAMLVLGLVVEVEIGVSLIVTFALLWLYPVLFEVMWDGQTPGKRVLGIRVVAANGAPVGWMAAFARNLLRVVDVLPIGYATGIVAGLIDPWGRRLGDLVAGTLVVHVPRVPHSAGIAAVSPQPPELPLTPTACRDRICRTRTHIDIWTATGTGCVGVSALPLPPQSGRGRGRQRFLSHRPPWHPPPLQQS